MTRNEIVTALRGEYRQTREREDREAWERGIELEKADPEIARLKQAQLSLVTEAARTLATNPKGAPAFAQKLRADGERMSAEILARKRALGFPEDYDKPRYQCPTCEDTGIAGNRFCACFERRVNERLCAQTGMGLIAEYTFQNFDTDIFSDEIIPDKAYSQRELALATRNKLADYAAHFPNTEKLNAIIMGAAGLGKTYLINCTAFEIARRGFDVAYISAYRMFEGMREKHMGQGDDMFRRMLACQLLAIDDLGTEPMMRNITIEYLFLLINERMSLKRHTLIATNMFPEDIRERYGERVSSRLTDNITGDFYILYGKDLRRQ